MLGTLLLRARHAPLPADLRCGIVFYPRLIRRCGAHAEALHPGHRIRIGAQQYLERFYASFGFETVSAPYDEDGIMHIDMLR